jgi:CRP-like cAMP-binding protein
MNALTLVKKNVTFVKGGTMSRLADLLGSAEVFQCLPESQREELASLAQRRSLEKGEVVCYQGDDWPHTVYIGNGELRSVINSPDGRSYIVSLWGKGEVFWGHTIFDRDPMPSTLEAAQASNLYIWDGEQALQFVLRSLEATRLLLRRQTQLIRRRRQIIYNLAFSPVASRLAKLIADRFEGADGPTVQRDLTLGQMAEMVATSPEVVCRLLYQFQASGTITISRASITLNDRQALENMILRE